MGGYRHIQRGRREDLGIAVRSAWEANTCRYLNLLVTQGQIQGWDYEPDVFYFRDVKRGPWSYCPDFRVTENDGRVVYYEVKGYETGADRSKQKRMREYYPDVEVRFIRHAQYAELERTVAPFIRDWEYPAAKPVSRGSRAAAAPVPKPKTKQNAKRRPSRSNDQQQEKLRK